MFSAQTCSIQATGLSPGGVSLWGVFDETSCHLRACHHGRQRRHRRDRSACRCSTGRRTDRSASAAAKAAAGFDFTGTLARICVPPQTGPGPDVAPPPPPARATWYTEPAKVFDNLYFVGTKIHSSWALTTSDGIILIDTLYDYASEEEIVGGLKKLGLDPAKVKYVIITHAHGDHVGGAKLMQDRFGSRIVMGGPDWDSIEKSVNRYPNGKPKRDIVATDGQKITLGDTSVTLVLDARPHAGHAVDDLPGEGQRQAADRGLFGRHGVQLPERRAAFRHLHRFAAQDGGGRRRARTPRS